MIDVFTIEVPRRIWGPHAVSLWDDGKLLKNFWCASQLDAETLVKKIAAALSKHSTEDVRARSATSAPRTRVRPHSRTTWRSARRAFPGAQADNKPPIRVREPMGFSSARGSLVHDRPRSSVRVYANADNSSV